MGAGGQRLDISKWVGLLSSHGFYCPTMTAREFVEHHDDQLCGIFVQICSVMLSTASYLYNFHMNFNWEEKNRCHTRRLYHIKGKFENSYKGWNQRVFKPFFFSLVGILNWDLIFTNFFFFFLINTHTIERKFLTISAIATLLLKKKDALPLNYHGLASLFKSHVSHEFYASIHENFSSLLQKSFLHKCTPEGNCDSTDEIIKDFGG